MRKIYVVSKDVWFANHESFSYQTGSHYIDLVGPGDTFTSIEDIKAAWAQGLDINGNMILLGAAFHNEENEDAWENLGEVAVLPHPTFEGNVKLKEINLDDPGAPGLAKANGGEHPHAGKKFKGKHLAALKNHAMLGITDNDTVLTVSKKASVIHPLVKVRGLR